MKKTMRLGRGRAICMGCTLLTLSFSLNAQLFGSRSGLDEYQFQREYRNIDGRDNNRKRPDMGAADTVMPRCFLSDYDDGLAALSGANRPSPRVISNTLIRQQRSFPNPVGASDFLWLWGQWLDHDITRVKDLDDETAPIPVPNDDELFDSEGTGDKTLPFKRSAYDTEASQTLRRQHINTITSWVDASNVYGSEPAQSQTLRTLDGTGRLRTSFGGFLPFEEPDSSDRPGRPPRFLAGDERVNEHTALMAMHTLFVREHNRFVISLAERFPNVSGEVLYQEGRAWVGALQQVITYKEFLPILLSRPFPEYTGYSTRVNGAIRNEFSSAAFRVGHTMVNDTLIRLGADFKTYKNGHMKLVDSFFNTQALLEDQSMEAIFRGFFVQPAQTVDVRLIDDLRNFLFPSESTNLIGMDLASLNIQRGRDHGLPTFMTVWRGIGGWRIRSFDDFHSRFKDRRNLSNAYDTIEQMDLWVGLLAERPLNGHLIGQALEVLIGAQFWNLRQADRFWYQRVYRGQQLQELEQTRLSDVIRRNTQISRNGIPRNVFAVPQSLRNLPTSFWKNR